MSSEIDTLKLEMRPFIKRSVTTAAGATPANNTLIDNTLTEPNDFWNGMAILIRTGTCAGEIRRILDYDLATTTLTVNVAFTAQIVAGVQYVMFFPTIVQVNVVAGGGLKADLQQVLGQGADLSPVNPLIATVYGDLGQILQLTPADGVTPGISLQVAGMPHVYDELTDTWNRLRDGMTLTTGSEPGSAKVTEVGVSEKASVQATAVADNTEIIAAPGNGLHLKVKTLHVFNSGDAAVAVGLRFTPTGDLHYRATLAPNTGYNMNLTHDDWHGGNNENFMVYTSVACTVDVTIGHEVMTP